MPPRHAKAPASKPAAAPVAPAPEPRFLKPLILGLAALALLTLFSAEVGDSDTWFHLRTGAYIVANHKLPAPDPFSWTTYLGKPAYPGEELTRDLNIKHEWLAQVILYLVYAIGGFGGMVLFRALCVTALCAAVGYLAWRRIGGFYLPLFAALACATLARGIAYDRPFIITYLILALVLWIYERRQPLWALPLIFLVWANTHGGYFLGWIVAGAYCAEALWQRLRKRPPADEKTLWAASLTAILASGLNPTWFNIVPAMIAYRHSRLQTMLAEWHPEPLWPLNWYSGLLLAAIAVLVWQHRKVRVSDWLLFAVFAYFALLAQRNVIFIGIVAPLLIVSYLPHWKLRLPKSAPYVLAAALFVFAGSRISQGKAFQLRSASWKYPDGAVRFLLDHHVTAPMFNVYEWGAYLMWSAWPTQRTFVDGRALNENVFQDYQRMLTYGVNFTDTRQLLDRYGVEVVLLEGFEYGTGNVYRLGAALIYRSQDWKLVYQDKTAMLFMRHPPADVKPLDPRLVFDSYDAQCSDHIDHQPELNRCARGLGGMYADFNMPDRSQTWLQTYLLHTTAPDPEAQGLLQQLVHGTFHAPAIR